MFGIWVSQLLRQSPDGAQFREEAQSAIRRSSRYSMRPDNAETARRSTNRQQSCGRQRTTHPHLSSRALCSPPHGSAARESVRYKNADGFVLVNACLRKRRRLCCRSGRQKPIRRAGGRKVPVVAVSRGSVWLRLISNIVYSPPREQTCGLAFVIDT
jgi:hypothetical protein